MAGISSNSSNIRNMKGLRQISGYRKLIVWIEAKTLVVMVYSITGRFPNYELFGLASQMRKAAVSVVSNIAEGWLRSTVKEKQRYLEMAVGSLLELESQFEVASSLADVSARDYSEFDKKRAQVMYLLWRYKQKMQ